MVLFVTPGGKNTKGGETNKHVRGKYGSLGGGQIAPKTYQDQQMRVNFLSYIMPCYFITWVVLEKLYT